MRKLMMKFKMSAVFLLSLASSALANADASVCNNISDEVTKRICTRAADGDAEAQFDLGVMHADDEGVPQSDTEAVKWFRLAAEQGSASAQFNLGFMYANGRGVPQNDTETVKWYRLAAEQGNARAQVGLGLSYALGQGVPQNNAYAHMWVNLAAAQGNSNGRETRDLLAKLMTEAQIAEAQRLASECLAKNYKGC